MGGKGIEVPIASETKAFKQGVEVGIIKPVKDAVKALDDLGDSKGPDQLEDGLRDAQQATAKLKKETKETADSIEKEFRDSYRKTKTASSDSTDSAREGLRDFRDESASTAREAAASFNGSAEDIASSFQEVAANALAGFGPIGAAAGLALAAGIGIATTEGQEAADAINDAKDSVGELALEIVDAGGDIDKVDLGAKIREWGVEIADSREWFEIWQDSAVSNIEAAKKSADQFGVSWQDMARGLSGSDSAAALRTIEALNDRVSESDDALAKAEKAGGKYSKTATTMRQENITLHRSFDDLSGKLTTAAGITGDAASAAKLLAEITADETAATEAATAATEAHDAALDIRNDKIAALQSGLTSAVGAYDTYKDAESGALDPAAYVANIAARIAATDNFASNVGNLTTQFGLSVEQQQSILNLGLDFAPMLDSIINSGLQGEFIAQIQAATAGGQNALDGSTLDATVLATADTAPAAGDLLRLTEEKRTTDVEVTAETTPAETALAAIAAKPRTATISAQADIAAAERALDSLVSRTRRVNIIATVTDRNGNEVL